MLGFRSHRRRNSRVSVIFDIGSASVGGALVKFSDSGEPRIVYTTRKQMQFQPDFDFKFFFDSMIKSLEDVAVDVISAMSQALEEAAQDIDSRGKKRLKFTRDGSATIADISCFFSSPWYITKTKHVSYKDDTDFILTPEMLDKIIKKEKDEFIETFKQAGGDVGGNGVKVMESKAVHLALNGYETSEPFGKRATEVHMKLFMSIISNETIFNVKKALRNVFSYRRINFHSFALSSFSVFRDLFPYNKESLVIDVSGEVTEISFVRNDIIQETIAFPWGKNVLIRKVAKGLKTFPNEAVTLLKIFLEGKSDDYVFSMITAILEEAENEWGWHFSDALARRSRSVEVTNVFLTADEDLGKWFESIIRKNSFGRMAGSDKDPVVYSLRGDELEKICAFNKHVSKDPFLSLETVYMNKLYY
jgi:cell division ATPase FtsA